jgi:hypothetical protein
MGRIDRFPVRLWLIEAPFNRSRKVRGHLGAVDPGSIQVLFEVQGDVGCEKRLIRFWTRTAKCHQHNDESEKHHSFWLEHFSLPLLHTRQIRENFMVSGRRAKLDIAFFD